MLGLLWGVATANGAVMRGRARWPPVLATLLVLVVAVGVAGPTARAGLLPLVDDSDAAPADGGGGAPSLSNDQVRRLAGGNRFASSAAAAGELWPGGSDTVVLATGLDHPDALAGAALAATDDAPMLLAVTDQLPASVRQTVIDLAPQRVVLLGGDAALSAQLAREVRGLPGQPTVERVAGANRFATAAAAAQAAGGFDGGSVAVADGLGFADALAAGSLAAGDDPTPVVLASDGGVAADLSTAERALLVGRVAPAAQAQARAQAATTVQLTGPTRWATSLIVANRTLTQRLSGDAPLVVATGQRFADALVAGAVAARSDAPLLLVPRQGPTGAQAEWIAEHHQRLTGAWIVGGTEAVSASAAGELASLLAGDGAGGGQTTIAGTLDGDADLEGGCVWLDTADGRYEVLWPDGWRASADPVALRNPDGDVVARRGDRVEVTGRRAEDRITTCQRGTIFEATEVHVD